MRPSPKSRLSSHKMSATFSASKTRAGWSRSLEIYVKNWKKLDRTNRNFIIILLFPNNPTITSHIKPCKVLTPTCCRDESKLNLCFNLLHTHSQMFMQGNFFSMALGLVVPQVDVSLLLPSSSSTASLTENIDIAAADVQTTDISPSATVINSPGNFFT